MSAAKLITRRDVIRGIAKRWHEQYGDNPERHGPDKTEIYRGLLALDLETCSPADVEAVIGNATWTRLKCNGCGRDVDAVVQVGDEPDYESSTADLCRSCAEAAAGAFR